MKNIHVLPTDKPSRFWMTRLGNLTRCHDIKPIKKALGNNVNIYITSDEEIKEGDWILFQGLLTKALKGEKFSGTEKVVLTTDQSLDGVQAIPDEFLEWFVQNPSCEFVEVETYFKKIGVETDANGYRAMDVLGKDYKIIIPQEESKRKIDTCYNFDKEIGCVQNICRCEQEEPKQETLEEAAAKYVKTKWEPAQEENRESFIDGAKWQAERMYREEDMKLSFETGRNFQLTGENNFNELIEQFKKK
jgi:hypothetical protein